MFKDLKGKRAKKRQRILMTYKKNIAEFIGTSFLLGTIVGSGIMSERLSAGIESKISQSYFS